MTDSSPAQGREELAGLCRETASSLVRIAEILGALAQEEPGSAPPPEPEHDAACQSRGLYSKVRWPSLCNCGAVPRGEPSPEAVAAANSALGRYAELGTKDSMHYALEAAYAVDRLPAGPPEPIVNAEWLGDENKRLRSLLDRVTDAASELLQVTTFPEHAKHNEAALRREITAASRILADYELQALPAGGEGGPGRCGNCGAPFEWVRPGKSQATCKCWATCHIHGPYAIEYHAEGEFPGISGYLCAECERALPQQETEGTDQ